MLSITMLRNISFIIGNQSVKEHWFYFEVVLFASFVTKVRSSCLAIYNLNIHHFICCTHKWQLEFCIELFAVLPFPSKSTSKFFFSSSWAVVPNKQPILLTNNILLCYKKYNYLAYLDHNNILKSAVCRNKFVRNSRRDIVSLINCATIQLCTIFVQSHSRKSGNL